MVVRQVSEWYEKTMGLRFTTDGIGPSARFIPMRHNWYVSTADLKTPLSDAAIKSNTEMEGDASSKIGSKIFNDHSKALEDFCQITYRRSGEAIVQGNAHRTMLTVERGATVY